jgi:hypothetical protein
LAVLAASLAWAGCRLGPIGSTRGQHGGMPAPAESGWPDESPAEQLRVLGWCEATRRALVAEVLAGRLTLAEAAAGFRAVDEVKGSSVPVVGGDFLGRTEAERLCQRVLLFAEYQARQRPDREAVLARLQGELDGLLGQDGGPRLPEFRRPAHIPWFEP